MISPPPPEDFLLSLGFRTWLLFPDFLFFSVVREVLATVTGFDLEAKEDDDDCDEACCDCELVVTVETDKLDELELDEDAMSEEAKCEVKLLWAAETKLFWAAAAAAEAATVKGATGATGTKAEGRRV